MKKKLMLAAAAAGTAVTMLPLLAAFEAHVINVTAKIENALSVPVKFLDYGTVFPQEYLVKDLDISLSQSFEDENRVDDVQYFIRQKPKCAITTNGGTSYDATVGNDGTHVYTATGHIILGDNPATLDVEEYWIDCGDAPRDLEEGEIWGVLPSLCPYLSKHKEDDGQEQEKQIDAFHHPFYVGGNPPVLTWKDAKGYLTKEGEDFEDNWKIDLAVPCFGNYCAQDWAKFVYDHNQTQDTQEEADSWTQPIANEHKIFGCDLWVEVSGVSTSTTPGTLRVVKVLINDDEGSAQGPEDFSFEVNGGSAEAFEADGQNDMSVAPGAYSVVELLASGYNTTYDNCDNVVDPGETETCTITNDDVDIIE